MLEAEGIYQNIEATVVGAAEWINRFHERKRPQVTMMAIGAVQAALERLTLSYREMVLEADYLDEAGIAQALQDGRDYLLMGWTADLEATEKTAAAQQRQDEIRRLSADSAKDLSAKIASWDLTTLYDDDDEPGAARTTRTNGV